MSHIQPRHTRLLLNCDMGESFGPWRMGADEQVMPLVDMASVACGFHAADPVTMSQTVRLALQAGVQVGAHPSYPDLVGFGRRSMLCTSEEITAMVLYQVGALAGICQAQGSAVCFVKPHGALYNDMMQNPKILSAILQAMAAFDASLPLVVLARADNSAALALAQTYGVPLLFEAFADRAYRADGQLLSRGADGAVICDPQQILQQALGLAREGKVGTVEGESITLQADTLCVHGDNAESVKSLQSIRAALDKYYQGSLP